MCWCSCPAKKSLRTAWKPSTSGSSGKYIQCVPLYGRLGKEEQERVFDPTPRGKTKVVISTNIAETSVTIDGIATVIDSGLSKLNHYNPRTFTSSLVEGPISKASCNQRKGRAGRTREGTCYRLYARKDFENRPLFTTEEIYRTDLSEVVLRMAELGVTAFEEFDFISPPNREGLIAAIETLNLLDALDPDPFAFKSWQDDVRISAGPKAVAHHCGGYTQLPVGHRGKPSSPLPSLSTQSPFILPPGRRNRRPPRSPRVSGPERGFSLPT